MARHCIEHSRRADAVYVCLMGSDVPAARTKRLDDFRSIDYDANGGIVGIEFLGVSHGIALDAIPFRGAVEKLLEGRDFRIYA